jgi:catechol 2,3-dioxygenase-like lactoylglutathione lyase family enzyme
MAVHPEGLGGRGLTQVALTCRDLGIARKFYRDTLGLPFLFEAGGMLFFQLEGLRLMIGQAHEVGQPIGGAVIYFDAPDIHALGSALEKKGITFLGPAHPVQKTATHELLLRAFYDPDGNGLALMGMVPIGAS